MWLLDANMPIPLVALLAELGIESDSAKARGWNTLSNGILVNTAAREGFSVLLTRDRLFAQSAAGALTTHPGFSVVRVTLPQLRLRRFLEAFRAAWASAPIIPVSGRMIDWPA
jgi:predicted nuclease of predicted toxin-antitoxin system